MLDLMGRFLEGGALRELEPEDRYEAVHLVESIWKDDPVFMGQADPISQGRFASAYVAVDAGGQLVGVGTLGEPSRHPHRFVNVNVDHSARRRGVGSGLLAALRADAGDAPLMSRLRPWDSASNRFYASHGFELAESVRSLVIDSDSNDVEFRVRAMPTVPDGGIELVEFVDDTIRDAAASVLARWYERTHAWSPPRPFSRSEARATFVDDVEDEALVVAAVSGRIVGVGVIRHDMLTNRDDTAHLEFAGVDPIVDAAGRQVLQIIYREVLRRAISRSQRVRFVVSEHNKAGDSALDTLPGEPKPELHIAAEPLTR